MSPLSHPCLSLPAREEWIEIFNISKISAIMSSLPAREEWIEIMPNCFNVAVSSVSSREGRVD